MPAYIEREKILSKLNDIAKSYLEDNSIQCSIAAGVVCSIKEEVFEIPTADLVEVEKVQKARKEILTRMNDFMSEYMKHGLGVDYFAGKSEAMETATRLVRAVFTDLLDEARKEGVNNG